MLTLFSKIFTVILNILVVQLFVDKLFLLIVASSFVTKEEVATNKNKLTILS